MLCGIACCIASVCWHYTMTTFTCSRLSINPCTMLCHSLLHDTLQWLHLPSHLSINPCTMLCHSLLHDTLQWLHLPSHLSINPCTMLCHSLLHDTLQWLHLPSHLSINPCTMLCHSLLHDTLQWLHLPAVTFPSTHALCCVIACCMTLYNDYIYLQSPFHQPMHYVVS